MKSWFISNVCAQWFAVQVLILFPMVAVETGPAVETGHALSLQQALFLQLNTGFQCYTHILAV